jgi:carbamoyltransferase
MTSILGLNAYHGDSSACLLVDGCLVAAAEEERFRRVKHWAGLPAEAMRWCLAEAGLRFGDVTHLAINLDPRTNNFRRALYVLTRRPDPRLVLSRLRKLGKTAGVEAAIRGAFPGEPFNGRFHYVEHHLAHLASGFLVSPFAEAVNVSTDGFGDFASAAWGMGRGTALKIDGRVYFPHSLGLFYSAVTQLLGFPHYGDEYKVMGLAPYGEPKFLDAMRQVVRVKPDGTYELNLKFFRHHRENVHYTWNDCSPEVGPLFTPAFEELLGPARKKEEPLEQRHRDIARSAQAMYEEACFALLNALHAKYRCPNLTLSGGCAMNSVANGKIYRHTPFTKLYLPAAAGDAGGAIGAAFVVHHRLADGPVAAPVASGQTAPPRGSTPTALQASGAPGPKPPGSASLRPGTAAVNLPASRFIMSHAYCGPGFSDDQIETLLRARGLIHDACGVRSNAGPPPSQSQLSSPPPRLGASAVNPPATVVSRIADESELCRRTAGAIAAGKVVGWFQGRMEWGPRALGNRSILGDPRRADMKDILNLKIKRRESFRPFAPSILRERVAEWFETEDDVPFMMEVFQFRPEKRAAVPAVCHVDGSGRLQTVHRETNPLYYRLISAFHELTGVPMVLNTSFNENEPVVCRPEEALDCFLRTKMDVLVLGHWFLERRE